MVKLNRNCVCDLDSLLYFSPYFNYNLYSCAQSQNSLIYISHAMRCLYLVEQDIIEYVSGAYLEFMIKLNEKNKTYVCFSPPF